jgi:hypothetical protein
VILQILSALTGLLAEDAFEKVNFEKQVYPVFENHCLVCHGPTEQKARLRLDARSFVFNPHRKSGPAIVKGDSAGSLLVKRLLGENGIKKMPLAGDERSRPLTGKQISLIRKWIDQGADWPEGLGANISTNEHWAYKRSSKPKVPAIQDPDWGKNPIDRFVFAQLKEHGLKPQARADRTTLIRRLYAVLIGLPPKPEELDAFLNDTSTDAWEKLVGKALKSPHYGERWGRHWLDVARFGESNGYESDNDRPFAFHYRDFVIKALNADMPFDQFAKWQLAGDEYAPGDQQAHSATGFLAAGPFNSLRPKEKEFYDHWDDMLGTTTAAFLGQTVACARCHDHKFDAISQKEYYQMLVAFRNTRTLNYTPASLNEETKKREEELARFDTTQRNSYRATLLDDLPETAECDDDQVTVEEVGDECDEDIDSLLDDSAEPEDPLGDLLGKTGLQIADPDGSTVRVKVARSGFLRKILMGEPFYVSPPLKKAMQIQWVELPLPDREVELVLSVEGDEKNKGFEIFWASPKVIGTDAREQPIDEKKRISFLGRTGQRDQRFGPVLYKTSHWMQIPAEARFRLATNMKSVRVGIGIPEGKVAASPVRFKIGLDISQNEWLKNLPAKAKTRRAQLEKQKNLLSKTGQVFCLMDKGPQPTQTWVLKRGEPKSKGEEVQLGFLKVATGKASPNRWRMTGANKSTSYQRTAMAEWLTDWEAGAAPLLARVIANRVWQHHFGKGLVDTPNNFGVTGSRPSHRELLDWLAWELYLNGWSLKHLHRQILMSAAWRLGTKFDEQQASIASKARESVQEKEGYSPLLLWRRRPMRFEAEVVRDSILAISGVLNTEMFGPSIKPWISPDAIKQGSTAKWPTNVKDGPATWRRSIYIYMKRSVLVPMMSAFGAPNATQSVGRRFDATIPPQSLFFLNDQTVLDLSGKFAERLRTEAGEQNEARIRLACLLAFCRRPAKDELDQAQKFLKAQTEFYESNPSTKGHGKMLALADFCQALLSSNEFIYIN